MTITLVTGGNKGLGRETARRLIKLGHTVYIGSRDAARGRAAADELGAELLLLDVTDEASVTAAAEELRRREGRLDVLVNNAGVFEGMVGAAEASGAHVATVLDVNVVGLVRVTHAFLPSWGSPPSRSSSTSAAGSAPSARSSTPGRTSRGTSRPSTPRRRRR